MTADEELEQVRRALAAEREARGRVAPTLGRLFGDTPGVRHTGDRPPGPRVVALERWAAQEPQE